ncbi:hypothetical protein ACP4OV_021222 [Aristida adscensionis]
METSSVTQAQCTAPSGGGSSLAPAPAPAARGIPCRATPQPPSVRPVTIPFSDLKERGKDLSGKIGEGLGPHGLGIISIADVPAFAELRKKLLRLAPRVAGLPDDVKKELENPDSRYGVGWSHGKQKLESGKFDTFKGSYFANPIFDIPTTDDVLVTRYPSFCRPNIWPTNHLPEFEIAFKDLGKLMFEVGLMLAHHCDRYVMLQGVGSYDGESLEQIIARSRSHKGRLLYYFPRQFSKHKEDGESISSWCGWHTDYGSLTGLTCGLFMRNSMEITCPDSGAGLYIRTRDNQVVKVILEDDELAYQIGETAEILSRGHLCATPHCVQAPHGENASDVARSTFALFMQPDCEGEAGMYCAITRERIEYLLLVQRSLNFQSLAINLDEKLKIPSEIPYHQELIPPNVMLTFGEYSERIVSKYYEAGT